MTSDESAFLHEVLKEFVRHLLGSVGMLDQLHPDDNAGERKSFADLQQRLHKHHAYLFVCFRHVSKGVHTFLHPAGKSII